MSIEKKSLISNRIATKKANVTKLNGTPVSSTKLARPNASSKTLAAPRIQSKLAVNMSAPKVAPRGLAVAMTAPKISVH